MLGIGGAAKDAIIAKTAKVIISSIAVSPDDPALSPKYENLLIILDSLRRLFI
jgi:hypothetical protein